MCETKTFWPILRYHPGILLRVLIRTTTYLRTAGIPPKTR